MTQVGLIKLIRYVKLCHINIINFLTLLKFYLTSIDFKMGKNNKIQLCQQMNASKSGIYFIYLFSANANFRKIKFKKLRYLLDFSFIYKIKNEQRTYNKTKN